MRVIARQAHDFRADCCSIPAKDCSREETQANRPSDLATPTRSLLIRAIKFTDSKLQMPPTGQLPADQAKDFEAWVKMGAPDPRAQTGSTQVLPAVL